MQRQKERAKRKRAKKVTEKSMNTEKRVKRAGRMKEKDFFEGRAGRYSLCEWTSW